MSIEVSNPLPVKQYNLARMVVAVSLGRKLNNDHYEKSDVPSLYNL